MDEETKKGIIMASSMIISIALFIVITIIWINSPLKNIFFDLWKSTENVWWNEELFAGTLGYIGIGIFSLFIYPAPLLATLTYSKTKKYLTKLWK